MFILFVITFYILLELKLTVHEYDVHVAERNKLANAFNEWKDAEGKFDRDEITKDQLD